MGCMGTHSHEELSSPEQSNDKEEKPKPHTEQEETLDRMDIWIVFVYDIQ